MHSNHHNSPTLTPSLTENNNLPTCIPGSPITTTKTQYEQVTTTVSFHLWYSCSQGMEPPCSGTKADSATVCKPATTTVVVHPSYSCPTGHSEMELPHYSGTDLLPRPHLLTKKQKTKVT